MAAAAVLYFLHGAEKLGQSPGRPLPRSNCFTISISMVHSYWHHVGGHATADVSAQHL